MSFGRKDLSHTHPSSLQPSGYSVNFSFSVSMNRDLLLKVLRARFNLQGLRDLSFALRIDYDALEGDEKLTKSLALLLYCERNNQFQRLIDEVTRLHPNPTANLPIGDDTPRDIEQDALSTLANNPPTQVVAAAALCTDSLDRVRSAIQALADYKDIHDRIHMIETVYKVLLWNAADFPSQSVVVRMFRRHADELITAHTEIRKALGFQTFLADGYDTSLWLPMLDAACGLIDAAVTRRDPSTLNQGISKLRRVVQLTMDDLNGRMTTHARAIDLRATIRYMRQLHAAIQSVWSSLNLLVLLGNATESLTGLETNLTAQTSAHNRWQNVRRRLWEFELDLDGSPGVWPGTWSVTRDDARALLGPLNGLAEKLHARVEAVEAGLAAGRTPGELLSDYIAFRDGFDIEFRSVDHRLKSLCDDPIAFDAGTTPVLALLRVPADLKPRHDL
jgi:Effector-associated domain 7